MQIVMEGMTRLVFVFEKNVIKVPWINFFKMVRCFKKYKKDGIFGKKVKRFNQNKMVAIFSYIFYLLSSNRREYLYFKKHFNEESLLPVTKAFIFGYIIVQPRGEVFDSTNPRWEIFLSKLVDIGVDNIDLLTPSNFCVFNYKIKLLDYGSDLTQLVLSTRGFEIIKE